MFREKLSPAGSNGFIDWEAICQLDLEHFAFEPKLDGSRYLLHLSRQGHHLTSRRESVRGGFVDKIVQACHLKTLQVPDHLEGTVLDGELMAPGAKAKHSDIVSIIGSTPERAQMLQKKHGPLVFMAFDLLFQGTVDVRLRPFGARRIVLQRVLKDLAVCDDKAAEVMRLIVQYFTDSTSEAQEMFLRELRNGNEGLMVKDQRTPYGHGMFKWKVYRDAVAIVTGYKQAQKGKTGKFAGLIGSVRFSVYDKAGKLVEVGQCSGMADKEREWITARQEDLVGEVIEVRGQEIDAKGRVRHPRFVRFRDDVDRKTCTLKRFVADMSCRDVVV